MIEYTGKYGQIGTGLMNRGKKLFITILAAVMLIACLLPALAAGTAALTDSDGGVVGVSNRGLRRDYPENSLEGILAAAETGIGWILTDVRRTADGTFVLFADETAERMLDGAGDKAVADMTFDELQSYYLKEYSGGAGAQASGSKVPLLEQALAAAKDRGFSLLLNADVTLLGELCDYLAQQKAADRVALLVNAKAQDISAALAGRDDCPPVIGVKRGNVIFAIWSYIKKAQAGGFAGVQLKTTNRYGVNFHQTVLGRFSGSLRAVANPTDSKYCGAREDSEKWWDDLISRGYSVIITDEAALFAGYLSRNDEARNRLSRLYDRYTNDWQLPNFRSALFNDYKKAYTDAVTEAERILNDASVSTREMNDCVAALQKAVDDINANYAALEQGRAGSTVTAPRIALCVAATAVVVAVQIFFFKKRKQHP